MPFPYQEIPPPTKANDTTPVDTVVFDYGMVLSGAPDPTAWARMRTLTGLDEARLHTSYWKFRHDYDRGALTGLAYWHAVAADTGIALTDPEIAALFADDVDLWTVPNPPMIEWAARLQRAGVRTGILSNIGDAIAEGIVARLPWLAGFDHCTWSHSLFIAKPEPAIFLKTAEALHTIPANILFIDDKQENVEAAAAVGMHAIQYTAQPAFAREMRARGFASLLDVGFKSRTTAPAAK
jgi:putative hydrolase of the HAD superfamily